jgi:hypothetical protein
MGTIYLPETSVINYHPRPRNIPKGEGINYTAAEASNFALQILKKGCLVNLIFLTYDVIKIFTDKELRLTFNK